MSDKISTVFRLFSPFLHSHSLPDFVCNFPYSSSPIRTSVSTISAFYPWCDCTFETFIFRKSIRTLSSYTSSQSSNLIDKWYSSISLSFLLITYFYYFNNFQFIYGSSKKWFLFLLDPSSQLQLNKYHYKKEDKNTGEMFTFKYGLFATECGSGTCRSHRELHSNFL